MSAQSKKVFREAVKKSMKTDYLKKLTKSQKELAGEVAKGISIERLGSRVLVVEAGKNLPQPQQKASARGIAKFRMGQVLGKVASGAKIRNPVVDSNRFNLDALMLAFRQIDQSLK